MYNSLIKTVSLITEFCNIVENAREFEKEEFVGRILYCLPQIYLDFLKFAPETVSLDGDYGFYQSYVDEDFYEEIRRNVAAVIGEDDIFLETFEEDMKYSDTPIASSISESLADIFQPLYNFISIVKETDGEEIEGAMRECRESFELYWSQTLCNVLRALNNLKFHHQ